MSEKAAKKTTVERVAELAMKLGGKHLADTVRRAAGMISRSGS